MSDIYEKSRTNLENLHLWYQTHAGQRNEATTRLHLIDELFFNCLGWHKDNIIAEDPYEGQYTDYTFLAPGKVLIVEAKKEGHCFEVPAGTQRLEYSIQSLARDNADLKSAIQQAAQYCQSRGVSIGVVSNGHQLVAFIATRSDGIPPLEGKALVFPSLDFMLKEFLTLWQGLSLPGVQEQYLLKRLLGRSGYETPPKLSKYLPRYPGFKNRNPFQSDLQIVSEWILEDITRDRNLEETFLRECYCQSGALSQYALVSKTILHARYEALFDSEYGGPSTEPAVDKEGISPEILAQSLSRRPILLIGDVGVGKSTFIRYLCKIEAADLFENAIVIYIDLGSQAMLAANIKEFVIKEIIRQLSEKYNIDIEEKSFIRSVYSRNLGRFGSSSIYAEYRETDPALYRHKELELLENRIQDRSQHLKDSLDYVERQQKKQIVIFIDNADQREDEVQQDAFLIAQEMAEHWRVTVFLTLRPSTFHHSLQSGALSGYHPKAFTISPPRVDRVLEKRLNFALKITGGQISLPQQNQIHMKLGSLDSLIKVFLDSMYQNSDLVEFLDNICGGNIRVALDMVRNFFGSGHVATKKIIDIYQSSNRYTIPIHEFLRSVIYGDYELYDPSRSPVVNIYDVSYADPKEHFLLPIILSFLMATSSTNSVSGFVDVSQIYEYIQGFGFTPAQIDAAIIRASKGNLIETTARRKPETGNIPSALRVTTIGAYHATRLCRFFSYIDAMIVDTPIFDPEIQKLVRDVQDVSQRMDRAEVFRGYLDTQWNLLKGENAYFDWLGVSSDLQKEISRIRSHLDRNRNDSYWDS